MNAQRDSKRFRLFLGLGFALVLVIGSALLFRYRRDPYAPRSRRPPLPWRERRPDAPPPAPSVEKRPQETRTPPPGSHWLGAPIAQMTGSPLADVLLDLLGSDLDAQSIAAFKLHAHQLPESTVVELLQSYATAPEETKIAILTAVMRSGSERIDQLLHDELKQPRPGELRGAIVRAFVRRFSGRVLDASSGGTASPHEGFWTSLLPDFLWLLKSEEDPALMMAAYDPAIELAKAVPDIGSTLREIAAGDANPSRRSALIQALPLRYPDDAALLRSSLASPAPEVRAASAKRLMKDLTVHRDWAGATAVFRMIESEPVGGVRTGLLNSAMSSLLQAAQAVKHDDPDFPQLLQTAAAFERTLEFLAAGRSGEAHFEAKALKIVRDLSARLRGQEPR